MNSSPIVALFEMHKQMIEFYHRSAKLNLNDNNSN